MAKNIGIITSGNVVIITTGDSNVVINGTFNVGGGSQNGKPQ